MLCVSPPAIASYHCDFAFNISCVVASTHMRVSRPQLRFRLLVHARSMRKHKRTCSSNSKSICNVKFFISLFAQNYGCFKAYAYANACLCFFGSNSVVAGSLLILNLA